MENKKIRPKSPLFFCFIVLILIMLAICISGNIVGFLEYGLYWLPFMLLVISVFLIVYLCCLLFSLISKHILITDHSIIVKKDRFSKFLMTIQHEIKVNINDLSNVYLTVSSNDSRNRSRIGLLTPMLYVVLENAVGESSSINVHYYTKNQIIGMLNDIIQRAKILNGLLEFESGEQIYNEFKKKSNR